MFQSWFAQQHDTWADADAAGTGRGRILLHNILILSSAGRASHEFCTQQVDYLCTWYKREYRPSCVKLFIHHLLLAIARRQCPGERKAYTSATWNLRGGISRIVHTASCKGDERNISGKTATESARPKRRKKAVRQDNGKTYINIR